jgi:hypothetical protein
VAWTYREPFDRGSVAAMTETGRDTSPFCLQTSCRRWVRGRNQKNPRDSGLRVGAYTFVDRLLLMLARAHGVS